MADRLVEKIDQNANGYTYFGQALPGTATSADGWSIQRMGVSGNVTTFEWADSNGDGTGDRDFACVWDNRTSLSYN